MDYFNGITNEEFIQDFITELYSVTEFVHEIDEEYEKEKEEYGDLDVDLDWTYGKHIMEKQDNLKNRLTELVSKNNLPEEEVKKIVDLKSRELFKVLLPMIDEYELKRKVDYGFNK